jgi:transcriptional regulator with XRE-family HTH domain
MEIKAANAEETIRCILDKEKMTQQDLADRMGITRQNISQSLNRNAKSMRYDSFSKMVTALGYEIVVKKL